jgi:hypothetical protein
MWAGQFTNFKTHLLCIIGKAIDEYHHSMINMGEALFYPAFGINSLFKQKVIDEVFNGNKRRIIQPSYN